MTPEAACNAENRRERKRQRLGSANPACALCGYDRLPSLVEAHHVAGAANDARLVVALCRNCHGELSDAAEDSLGALRLRDEERDPLTRLAAMMLGLADLFRLLGETFEKWAQYLRLIADVLRKLLGNDWPQMIASKASDDCS
jgi:hypothetical protein